MSANAMQESVPGTARLRLLDVARDTIRRRHYSYRTEETYLHWMKRFKYCRESGRAGDRQSVTA